MNRTIKKGSIGNTILGVDQSCRLCVRLGTLELPDDSEREIFRPTKKPKRGWRPPLRLLQGQVTRKRRNGPAPHGPVIALGPPHSTNRIATTPLRVGHQIYPTAAGEEPTCYLCRRWKCLSGRPAPPSHYAAKIHVTKSSRSIREDAAGYLAIIESLLNFCRIWPIICGYGRTNLRHPR
jgi:hypothetical protein